MTVSLDDRGRDGNQISILLEGKIALRDAPGVLQGLDDAVKRFAHIEIDMSAVVEVDLCALQLLVSARKSASALGRKLTLVVAPNGAVAAGLIRVGLVGRDGRPRNAAEEFWSSVTRIAVKAA